MAIKRLLTEFGMGSSLRRRDYTEAAKRAVRAVSYTHLTLPTN